MEEMVMEGQRKCKETQEIIQIVLNELECTEVELKSRSEYVRSIMKQRRSFSWMTFRLTSQQYFLIMAM